jgi:hypothetical protein
MEIITEKKQQQGMALKFLRKFGLKFRGDDHPDLKQNIVQADHILLE